MVAQEIRSDMKKPQFTKKLAKVLQEVLLLLLFSASRGPRQDVVHAKVKFGYFIT